MTSGSCLNTCPEPLQSATGDTTMLGMEEEERQGREKAVRNPS